MRKLMLRRKPTRAARPTHNLGQAPTSRENVAEILGYPLQTKLKVGAPDDAHEREADAVAERILAMPEGHIQRKCDNCIKEDEDKKKSPPEAERKDEEVQRKAKLGDAGMATSPSISLPATGSSQPLPASEQAFFESRMGAPLGQVRVHTDDASAQLAANLSARAFTVGQDVYFGSGEYRPGTHDGRRLLAHELTHTLQQGESGLVRRWKLGTAPAPHGWSVVTDTDQLKRLGEAEKVISGAVASKNCQNHFKDKCTNAVGANALKDAFDKATVFLRPHNDNVFGEGEFGGHNLAFNLRAYRIGSKMLASTLLHEMFHNCDSTGAGTGRAAELSAENAVESCRVHTPWIESLSRRSGPVGSQVTITGWNFGPTQSAADSVQIGGVSAAIVSWVFMNDTSSRVEIVAEVPAGAGKGGVVVINNGVRSNAAAFAVT